jgi:hypothetical protein
VGVVGRRHILALSRGLPFLLLGLVLFLIHLPFLRLPYFWDEAGQFVPAALDLLRFGAWIPHSAAPNIHPPALMAYLAAVWRLAGATPLTTRTAMLLLAFGGSLAALFLARELLQGMPPTTAWLAISLLLATPLFFTQSLLAQLDLPAMSVTALALFFFLRNRIWAAAAACVALVWIKETGLLVPLVLALWLIREKRYRDAAAFFFSPLALGVWVALLWHKTGHWAGSVEFAHYNLSYPLAPGRILLALLRRFYYLFWADFRWIGSIALLWAWRKKRCFASRSWQLAWLLIVLQILLVSVLGGAVLDRYLLPVLPLLYTAMGAAVWLYPRNWRWICGALLLGGIAASNFINPPYPAPYEDNLAFTDFLALHEAVAGYLVRWYSDAQIQTSWPLTAELSRPELGFVGRPLAVRSLPDLSSGTLRKLDWGRMQILVVFSRDWDPPHSPLHLAPVAQLWRHIYSEMPDANQTQIRDLVPFPASRHFAQRGQWVDIYVNPGYSEPTPMRLAQEK